MTLLIMIVLTIVLARAECVVCPDFNNDGWITEYDKSVFVNCVYYGINCSLHNFDLNGDNITSIVGDVPCFPEFNQTEVLNISASEIEACKYCTDTDGGRNYYVKGHVQDPEHGGADYWDTCTNLETTDTSKGWFPTSTGKILMEYYCGERNYQYEAVLCPYGCQDGACIKEDDKSINCTDTDGGLNYYVKGECSDSRGWNLRDGCIANREGWLYESYCYQDGCSLIEYECPYGCRVGEGVCINCTESWVCGDWTECNNGMMTRTCTDANKCGGQVNKPNTIQNCTPGGCIEEWNCTSWSPCIAGTHERVCVEMNYCGTQINLPQITKACEFISNLTGQIKNQTRINDSGIQVVIKNTSMIGGIEAFVGRIQEQTVMLVEDVPIPSKMQLEERERKIYVKTTDGDKEIKVTPSDALGKATKIQEVISIEIQEHEGLGVYAIKGTKTARLFFVYPLRAEVQQKINVEDGKVVYTKRPWWHILALGI